MSGSGGGGGYEYQARAAAYINAHILAQQPLGWLLEHSTPDVPIAVVEETNGPGDDINITLEDGAVIELQAKHGLKKDKDFWEAIVKLANGLRQQPSLYGILLTDSTASGTIKDKLRQDLKRLGQGRTDDLKKITQEVIDKLNAEDIRNTTTLFRRLQIIVIDLDDDSQGAKSAQILLSQVINDQKQAGQAWNTLVKDGFSLITNRGRRDSEGLARLLSRHHIQLSATGVNLAVVAERYRAWLRETTTHFTVPGLGIELPIETAWIQLQAYGSSETEERDRPKTIEEWLASYHEWSRLAARREDRSKAFDADYIAEFNRQIVVIGGPGAGKSTLLRRVAHRLAGLGKRVLLIRLPHVAKYFEQGKTFEEAILKVAADGSGIEIDQLQLILANRDYLLADGLDECDPQRATIANALFRWVAGHSHTRVVVTTRPVGHDAGLLPGWEYAELLPLDPQGIRKNAQQLIEAKFTDKTQLEEQLALFEQRLETNRTASLAARNPLLLGFLVQLSINGIELVQQRAGLYESIIELVYNQSLPDRESKTDLDAPVAFRVIETIGWILQTTPGIPERKLVELLGQELANELDLKPLAAQREAQKGLEFWEERRIIERLSVGHQNAVTFVHPSLGEYAAGRYASRLSEKEVHQWLARVRRQPKWRESILFCAGAGAAERISTQLLELDNPEEPTSTEAVLAAAALAETTEPPLKLMEAVANQILPRLKSPIPDVVFEAAQALLALADLAPNIIGTIAQSLFKQAQSWTRLAATMLALACGEDYVDLDILKEVLDNIIAEPAQAPVPFLSKPKKSKRYGRFGWEFQNHVLLQGFQLLLKKQPGLETAKQIEQIISTGTLSFGTSSSLRNLLTTYVLEKRKSEEQQEDIEEWKLLWCKLIRPDKLFAEFNPRKLLTDLRRRERTRDADRAILEAVLRTTDSIPVSQVLPPQALVHIGALIGGIGWENLSVSEWDVMGHRHDLKAVDAVLKGMIAVLEIDPQRVATEAASVLEDIKRTDSYDLDAIEVALQTKENIENKSQGFAWALEQIEKLLEESKGGSLFGKIPQVPVKFRWQRAREVDLSPKDLVRALDHPSEIIVRSAALLLANGARGNEVAPVESLRIFKSKLIELFDSPYTEIREIMVRALASADWLDREEAIILAQKALQDNDLAVRDQAVETLRILESQ
ncbi:MAG TPA: hypothetical protein DDZ80_07905 [Cyanobacteria bacterium UBA8803]|nr:hypothetical protein [Cyanobacteria bacterium UBA9273]HBL58430.1 hypothetical protein [Cyanobacteria bacterium UBA8803]